MSWEGVGSQPRTKLPPNSLPNPDFLTKNSPSAQQRPFKYTQLLKVCTRRLPYLKTRLKFN